MNSFHGIGRLVADPTMKKTPMDCDIANFTIAIDRTPDKTGQRKTDFIPCVAFGKTAITIGKHFSKGSRIAVIGSLNIDQVKRDDGTLNCYTKINVVSIDFIDYKKKENQNEAFNPEEIDDANVPF